MAPAPTAWAVVSCTIEMGGFYCPVRSFPALNDALVRKLLGTKV